MNSIKEVKMVIWGREFTLPVEYEYFSEEYDTDEQISAIKDFAEHEDWVDKAKGQVESYCKDAVEGDAENNKKDNIFSYIKPDYLFVERKDSEPRVAIMCKYRYNPEHGVAIIFTHDGKVHVGLQDIIL